MSAQDECKFGELKKKVQEQLKVALEIDKFYITFVNQDKSDKGIDVWRVNVEFGTQDDKNQGFVRYASFMLDTKSLEVLRFERDRCWDRKNTSTPQGSNPDV